MKNEYRKKMDAAEKKSVLEQMDHLRLMLDKPLTREQSRYVKKALGYCWVDGLVFQDHVEEKTKEKERKMKKNFGKELVKTAVLFVLLFATLPSNVRAQSINSATDVYDSTKGITNVSSHQSINHDQGGSGGSLGINPLLQPEKHAIETGSKNDSNWTGPNFFVTLEEAKQLAEQQRLATANNNLSIAEAAKKAKEEADKTKAASAAKTVTVVVQDGDGNMVYVKKVRKP